MPNIKSYDQPALEIRPTEIGVESTAAAARRGMAFYNQAAAAKQDIGQRLGNVVSVAGDMAVKYVEHRELSAGAANFAQMQDGIVNAWDKTAKAADPNDPSTAANFRSGMEPTLNKFKESFITEGGQQWAQAQTDRLRLHMFEKTNADMSSLGATAVQQNALKTINSLGNTTYNDPSALSLTRDTLKSTVEGMVSTSNATGVRAQKLREDLLADGEKHLVRSAVTGAIAKGGDWQKIASDPKNVPFIDQAETEKFAKEAKRQERADLLTQRQFEVLERQQNERAFHSRQNEIFSDNVTYDEATGRPLIKPDYFKQTIESSKMPGATAGAVESRMTWGEHQQRLKAEPITDNPEVARDLTDRMFSATNPTTELDLMKANQPGGGLSDASFRKMHGLVELLAQQPLKDQVFRDTLHGAKSLLGTDSVGNGKYASFVQDFIPQYLAAKRTNTLPPNALDLKNPDSMISQAMKPYQRSAMQLMLDRQKDKSGLELPPIGTPAGNVNLTGPGKSVTGTEIIDIPVGTSPAEAMKQYKSGTPIRLPDGRIGTVP